MALDKESKNHAYLLGRMLAILEHGMRFTPYQKTTAMEFPGQIFATLIRDYESRKEHFRDDELTEIMGEIPAKDPFPMSLSVEDCGRAWIGYYHERADIAKEENRRKVAKAVKLKRTELDLTQEQLAEKAGITKQTIVNIESGCNVSMDILSAVTAVLGVDISIE